MTVESNSAVGLAAITSSCVLFWRTSAATLSRTATIIALCAATAVLSTTAPWPGTIFVSGRASATIASNPASMPFIVPPLARSMFG